MLYLHVYCNFATHAIFVFDFVAEREEGRLRNEIKRIQNDLNELNSRRNIAEVF